MLNSEARKDLVAALRIGADNDDNFFMIGSRPSTSYERAHNGYYSSIDSEDSYDEGYRRQVLSTDNCVDDYDYGDSEPTSEPETNAEVRERSESPVANNGNDSFHVEFYQSKYGKHRTAAYILPNTRKCYVFSFQRQNKDGSRKYNCLGCQKLKKNTFTKIIGDEFDGDPDNSSHFCTPQSLPEELATRAFYKKLKTVDSLGCIASVKPRDIYEDVVMETVENAKMEPLLRKATRDVIYGGGYDQRRRGISKRVHKKENKLITMENVTPAFERLSSQEQFLHFKSSTLHIYYSKIAIEKVVNLGLTTVLSDGSHKHQPRALGRSGQIYTVHGVCDDDVCVPIMFCVTGQKTENIYFRIFSELRKVLEELGKADLSTLRFVTDYEKAAIQAIRRVFGTNSVQGCSFHAGLTWARYMVSCGLKKYCAPDSKKRTKCTTWWKKIKGCLFLPQYLLPRVKALKKPPVKASHPAYDQFVRFLKYFKKYWLNGFYKDIWGKFQVHEHRSTNLAEAYHRRLQDSFPGEHLNLSTIILRFRIEVELSDCELTRAENNTPSCKILKKEDKDRRKKVTETMNDFKYILDNCNRVPIVKINKYIIKMSKCVSSKVK